MATKDYVKRGRVQKKAPTRQSRKAPTTVADRFPKKLGALALVLTGLLGYGLFYLSHSPAPEDKTPEASVTKEQKQLDQLIEKVQQTEKKKDQLPPKPEEKWRYIKELENKVIQLPTQDEKQRLAAEKAQAERARIAAEKAARDKAEAERRKQQQEAAQKSDAIKSTVSPAADKVADVAKPKPVQPTTPVVPTEPVKPQPKPETKPVTKPSVRYIVQCGAYHSAEQANERKATIAFQGFNSQVSTVKTSSGTWHKVFIGPYPDRDQALKARGRLQSSGIEPCAILSWK
ncbi:cell division protein FtsN [Photobacterium damselae subsp. damselae]|uniref:cell division protein FtsN n=1 Tax=Photobacterium damselae TaxID=38293 RepID=UPI001EED1DF0|nr:cell division protein FtsN [Photobacterium damselae]UJZ94047.1 cell division protein FtsN [Photobacterium damselae subsp. damselae]UJZ98028.1 cell division protein FtsN [Photobacterium damselae subsp. damselae]